MIRLLVSTRLWQEQTVLSHFKFTLPVRQPHSRYRAASEGAGSVANTFEEGVVDTSKGTRVLIASTSRSGKSSWVFQEISGRVGRLLRLASEGFVLSWSWSANACTQWSSHYFWVLRKRDWVRLSKSLCSGLGFRHTQGGRPPLAIASFPVCSEARLPHLPD